MLALAKITSRSPPQAPPRTTTLEGSFATLHSSLRDAIQDACTSAIPTASLVVPLFILYVFLACSPRAQNGGADMGG